MVATAAVLAANEHPPRADGPGAEPTACPASADGVVSSGNRGEREVAITFDDGPSDETRDFLGALERRGAPATFFVVGREIPGREDVLREAVAAGHEIANHSTSHMPLPSGTDVAETSELIERATGRAPCAFRPPEGRYSDRLLADARRLGMSVVTWDVDPEDWLSQDPAGIRERALAAVQPGSIVLMHDGGGDRTGTERSLSALIDALRARDYELVTVSELLRNR